jgi:hypothetical protein
VGDVGNEWVVGEPAPGPIKSKRRSTKRYEVGRWSAAEGMGAAY